MPLIVRIFGPCYGMEMWNFVRNIFLRRPAPRKNVAEALDEVTRAKALAEARFLYSKGAWVRDLNPGEVPGDEPEIGDKPM